MKPEFKNEDLYCCVKNAALSDKAGAKYNPFIIYAKTQLGNLEFAFWLPAEMGIEKDKPNTWPAKSGDFLKISIVNFSKAEAEYYGKQQISLQGNYSSNFIYKVINEEDIPDNILQVIYVNRKEQIEFAKSRLKESIVNQDFWENKELGKVIKESIEKRPEFIKCPAAIRHHHAYEGGLLVHTNEVNFICNAIADACNKLYPNIKIDRDVLNLSSWLHDIGKSETYYLDKNGEPGIYGEKENKVNHILRSHGIFNIIAEKYKLDSDFIEKVGHCILSHQDRIEWDSPVEPIDIEAIILAKADKISSELAKNE
jgi:23S rRNA maturation-related 3'-5' exoribonuclease YhaM